MELEYTDPFIYDSSIPHALLGTYPTLNALLGGTRLTGAHVTTLTSAGGTKFTHFAKDNSWGKDLYDDLVEPYFKMSFEWETWRRAPFLTSLCPPTTQYQTLNVASISLGSTQFPYTKDHSKWGVSLQPNWVCVGGINRMQSQRSRGGQTMCIARKSFWTALSATVASSEPCPVSVSLVESEIDAAKKAAPIKSKIVPKRTKKQPKHNARKHRPKSPKHRRSHN